MTTDTHLEPRCTDCGSTLMRAGATCISCQHDEHYEGATRTAPPIVAPRTAPTTERAAS